jgi:hypothetical protein
LNIEIKDFYNYYAIPIQFIFWFWFYAQQFNKIKIFYYFVFIYIIFVLVNYKFFGMDKIFISFTYLVGCLLIFYLTIKEFIRQFKSEDILFFYKNPMFYINIGVFMFYIGSVPFYSFLTKISKDVEILKNYHIFSLIINCIMYLLFTASFICGNRKLK